jgi:hypothetical protein
MLRTLGIAAFVAVIGLALLELVLGIFFVPPSGSFPDAMFVADATRGLALAPGFSRIVARAGHRFQVSVNQEGYRDAPWPTDDRPRVLLAGSSALFGVGLPAGSGIAAKLRERLGNAVAVINLGVYSYGPPQVLRTIERECPRLHPRVVVYLHEYKNTRRDFLADRRPQSGDTGEVEAFGSGWSWRLTALRAFLSARYLHPRQIAERLVGLQRLSPHYLERYLSTAHSPDFPPQTIRMAVALIEEMRQAAARCGARFLTAVLPSPAEAYYGAREPASDAVLAQLAAATPPVFAIDTRAGIPLGSRFNLIGLDYFNERGTAWVAGRLAPAIEQLLRPS